MPKAPGFPALDNLRQACRPTKPGVWRTITYPGFHMWELLCSGRHETLSYADAIRRNLQEWFEWDMQRGTRKMELALERKLDFILFGGSGTITDGLAGARGKYAIPA